MMNRRGKFDGEADVPRVRRFRMLRYFMLTSLVVFAAVGTALYFLQRGEEAFFADVQREQGVFFAQAQSELSTRQDQAARENLLAVHEAGHVALTRVLANVMWETRFAPFVARAGGLSVDACRDLPTGADDARRECFADVGRAIMALPGFAELDAHAHAAMRSSNVFKVKVFDLRGITVYSSEHAQIGDDKSDNAGWKAAADGRSASELTHRDRFSAFEGVVENRDLISSYIPVRAPGGDRIVGVFEIYSDVTGFLERIRMTSAEIASRAAANQGVVERTAADNQARVEASSNRFLYIVGGLLALLYVAMLLLVRNGQRIIDLQADAQERAAQREERWHHEKMAALATMAANVSHEVGNPLATISMVAQEILQQKMKGACNVCEPGTILDQARRIACMTRQISDFASARRQGMELVDLNQMVKAVLDFLGFDRRFRAIELDFRPDEDLAAQAVIPDHLNEVLMNLLQACTECPAGPGGRGGRIVVETLSGNGGAVIRIHCECNTQGACAAHEHFDDSRFDVVRRRIRSMGGTVTQSAAAFEITLSAPDAATTEG